MAKIVMLTGSPRKGGNTDVMVDAFIKGAESAGHSVSRFDAGRKKLGGCKACDTCWSKGVACSFRDDFAELEPMLEQADILVLATPLYWFGFSAQVKAALDRLYAYMGPDCKKPLGIRGAALLICGGDDVESHFGGAHETFRQITDYLQWKNLGILTATAVNSKGDILNTEFPRRAEELGRSMA